METIFIAWSGRDSQAAAEILRKYLPLLLHHGLKVFMSKHDVSSGVRWASEVASELAHSNFGIICLTPDNLEAPWIMFEAGALTKNATGRACGLLFRGLTIANITGPLEQFQNREFSEAGFRQLLDDISKVLNSPVEPQYVDMLFEKFWPEISNAISGAMASQSPRQEAPRRSPDDLLEEVVERVRTLEVLSQRDMEWLRRQTDELISFFRKENEKAADVQRSMLERMLERMEKLAEVSMHRSRDDLQSARPAGVAMKFGDARKAADLPMDDESPAKQRE